MQTKQCQMLKAENYLVALRNCDVSENIDIPEEELTNIIASDVARSCFISQTEESLHPIWLEKYKQDENNKYYQGRIEGNIIPSTKMTHLRMLLNQYGFSVDAQIISFTFRDDNNKLCGFSLTAWLENPSIWFASLTVNTEACQDNRQVTVFIPEFSKKQFKLEVPQDEITKLMTIKEALVFPMDSFGDYLSDALNCEFISYFLRGLFDSQGQVFPDQFKTLQQAIKNKAPMFDFSREEKALPKPEPISLKQALLLINTNHAWANKNLEVLKEYIEFTQEEASEENQEDNKKAMEEANFVLDFNTEIKGAIENLVTEHPDREQILASLLRDIREIKTREKLFSTLNNAIFDLLQLNKQCPLGEALVKLKNLLTPIDDAPKVNIKKTDKFSSNTLAPHPLQGESAFKRPEKILGLDELKPYYSPKALSLSENMFFQGTLSFNKLMSFSYSNEQSESSSWNPYDEVLHRIYLGRIPEYYNNPLPKDVGLVVSVITYGELAGVYFPFEDFCAKGGKHIFIHMEDFTAEVSGSAQINAFYAMKQFLQASDKKIYVHCKAGASRSASFVATYHSLINDIPIESAIDFVRSKRNQVYIGEAKQNKASSIIKLAKDKEIVVEDQAIDCMATLEAKTLICQLPSFKALALYAARSYANSKRALCIVSFFGKILSSQEASWFLKLEDKNSDLMQFINCQPQLLEDDRPLRKQLVDDFVKEIRQLEAFLAPFYEERASLFLS